MAKLSKGGAKLPIQSVALHGWDDTLSEWTQLVLNGGDLGVNINQVGGVDQTGDDWTLRFQALNDDTVRGLMRSLGDAGVSAANATGRTVLQLLEDVENAISSTPTNQWNPLAANGSGTSAFDVDLDTGMTGGRSIVNIQVSNTSGGSDYTIQGSNDGFTYLDLFSNSVPAVGGTNNESIVNAYRYLRVSVTSVASGTTNVSMAATR